MISVILFKISTAGGAGRLVQTIYLRKGALPMELKTEQKQVNLSYMTARQAARYLGFSPSYFYKLNRRLRFPYHDFGPGTRKYYNAKELDDFIHRLG